jgi:hypothetical protein
MMSRESIADGRKEFVSILRDSQFVAGNIGAHLSRIDWAMYAIFEGHDGWR